MAFNPGMKGGLINYLRKKKEQNQGMAQSSSPKNPSGVVDFANKPPSMPSSFPKLQNPTANPSLGLPKLDDPLKKIKKLLKISR